MTEWSRYVAYKCRHRDCQDDCINLVVSAPAQNKQCRDCIEKHGIVSSPRLVEHLPKKPLKA